jgi:excinuclease UvrABC ATPase subunit
MFTRPVLGRALRVIALRAKVGLRSCCGLATGTPEEVARKKASVTGRYLAPYLK